MPESTLSPNRGSMNSAIALHYLAGTVNRTYKNRNNIDFLNIMSGFLAVQVSTPNMDLLFFQAVISIFLPVLMFIAVQK
jgi:hypothetical protein